MTTAPSAGSNTGHRIWRVVGLVLAILGLGILSWIAFAAFFPGWLGWRAYNYAVDSIVNVSGWNRNLVRSVAILLFLPFVWAIGELIRVGLMTRVRDTWTGRHSALYRRRAAAALLVAYASAFFFMMYLAAGNFAMSGEALRYYAVTPQGIRLFDEPGHDPTYGIELKPITPEIAQSIERARTGLKPEPISLARVPSLAFFDGNTGAPRVWFLARSDGGYDLFSSPGFHPGIGEPLKPITADVVAAVRAYLDELRSASEARATVEQRDRQAKTAAEEASRKATHLATFRRRHLGDRPTAGKLWLAVSRNGAPNSTLAVPLSRHLGEASLFSDAFLHDGLMQRLEDGETSLLDELGLRDAARVTLVKVSARESRSLVAGQEVVRSDVALHVWTIQPATGAADVTAATGYGAGLDVPHAEAQALERALATLSRR